MKEKQFREWLLANGYQEKVVQSRITNVKKIEGVYPDLDSRIEDGTITNLLSAFTYNASDRKHNREPLHKIQIDGDQYSGTATYKAALSLYLKFYYDTTDNTSANDEDGNPDMVRTDIFDIDGFKEWCLTEEKMTKEGVSSYKSNMNWLNTIWHIKSEDKMVFEAISSHLLNDNIPLAFKLLKTLDKVLSNQLADPEKKDGKSRINDARSAVRKYTCYLEHKFKDN